MNKKPTKQSAVCYLIIGVQAVILLATIILFTRNATSLDKTIYPASALTLVSGEMTEEGTAYIDESVGGSAHFLYGPYATLGRGSYRMRVNYEATAASSFFWPYAVDSEYNAILSDTCSFDPSLHTMTTEFYTTRTVDQVECRIIYAGEGSVKIISVEIEETIYGELMLLFGVLFALILFNICWFAYSRWKKSGRALTIQTKYVTIGLIGICLLSSMPVFMDYLISGHDMDFHLMRIEGIKDGLRSGHFPVRIQPTWFGGAGYATSIFYGELFLYFPALLRLIGLPVQLCYQIFQFSCNVATCLIAYGCMKKMTKNQYAALLGALVYTMSPYRLTDVYLRNAVGEHLAMTFLPLIIYGMWLILHKEPTDLQTEAQTEGSTELQENARQESKSGKRRALWLPLALGMTGMIQSHIITCEMVAILLGITCLVFIVRLFRDRKIIPLLQAAGATIVLNLWFLVPFLDYFRGSYQVTSTEGTKYIQETGTYLAQLFMLFPNFNKDSGSTVSYYGMGDEMPLIIGMALGIGALLMIALYWTRVSRRDGLMRQGLFITLLGLLAAFMSTTLFPWDSLAGLSGISAKMIQTMQFVWRFLAPAVALLAVGTAFAVANAWKHVQKEKCLLVFGIIAVFAVISGVQFMNTWVNGSTPYRIYSDTKLNVNYGSSNNEYLPAGSNVSIFIAAKEVTGNENLAIGEMAKNGTELTVHLTNFGGEETASIPYVYYPGYEARCVETGEKLAVGSTADDLVGVTVPEGFSGTIEVSFEGFWYWHLADWLTVIGIAAYVVYRILIRRRTPAPDTDREE